MKSSLSAIHDKISAIAILAKGGPINVGSLANGGTKPPRQGFKSGIKLDAEGFDDLPEAEDEDEPDDEDDCETSKSERVFIPIVKANDEQQTVTGIVLRPEVTDAQGDILSVDVIRNAAYSFLAKYNRQTKLGLQHKEFKAGRFALVESYLAPIDFALASSLVTAGSWVVTVKVLDSKIWAMVKDGKITGFSIGGRAKVQNLSA